MDQILQIFRDLPGFLDGFILNHGPWVYALLFAIVFCETGLVVTPFLPGDSLLFTVGAIAARGSMNVWLAGGLLFLAAVLGNTTNYWIGKSVGPRIFRVDGQASTGAAGWLVKALNRKHLDKAHAFFEKHGGKAVMMGQFIPIVRTFCPFVAGAGSMSYSRFLFFNVVGALIWVSVCCTAGYLFGNTEFVKKHFELVVVGVIAISLLPVVIGALRSKSSESGAVGALDR